MRPLIWLGVISLLVYLYHLSIIAPLAIKHTGSFSATGLSLMAQVHVARTEVLYGLRLAITAVATTVSYRLIGSLLRRKERWNTQMRTVSTEERAERGARIIDVS